MAIRRGIMPEMVTRQEAIKKLALAVCRQWVNDGKPENGREGTQTYASILINYGDIWYRQARLQRSLKRGGK